MYVEQRLQQLRQFLGEDEETLPPRLGNLLRDGERVSVPMAMMDSLSREVFEDGLRNQTLSLKDAQRAAADAREEAGRRLVNAWKAPSRIGEPPRAQPAA